MMAVLFAVLMNICCMCAINILFSAFLYDVFINKFSSLLKA
jgi:hypothetical protein